ncbi:unnamed protein product [Gadus morhua 'NCC']
MPPRIQMSHGVKPNQGPPYCQGVVFQKHAAEQQECSSVAGGVTSAAGGQRRLTAQEEEPAGTQPTAPPAARTLQTGGPTRPAGAVPTTRQGARPPPCVPPSNTTRQSPECTGRSQETSGSASPVLAGTAEQPVRRDGNSSETNAAPRARRLQDGTRQRVGGTSQPSARSGHPETETGTCPMRLHDSTRRTISAGREALEKPRPTGNYPESPWQPRTYINRSSYKNSKDTQKIHWHKLYAHPA